jgi:hypothetical protein
MAYQQPHTHEPASPPSTEPDSGGWAGYAAIKYTALVIIVLAIIGFLVWAITQFAT